MASFIKGFCYSPKKKLFTQKNNISHIHNNKKKSPKHFFFGEWFENPKKLFCFFHHFFLWTPYSPNIDFDLYKECNTLDQISMWLWYDCDGILMLLWYDCDVTMKRLWSDCDVHDCELLVCDVMRLWCDRDVSVVLLWCECDCDVIVMRL